MEGTQEAWLRLEEFVLTGATIMITVVFFIAVLTLIIDGVS